MHGRRSSEQKLTGLNSWKCRQCLTKREFNRCCAELEIPLHVPWIGYTSRNPNMVIKFWFHQLQKSVKINASGFRYNAFVTIIVCSKEVLEEKIQLGGPSPTANEKVILNNEVWPFYSTYRRSTAVSCCEQWMNSHRNQCHLRPSNSRELCSLSQ